MSTAIEFDHVGKQYRLGLVSTKTLSHDLNRWWQMSVLKKEDPYLRIGEVNDRSIAGNSEYVWALRDIDFKIEQGDVVGIIGKNGAGKSTLLKLLSKVTGPTTGSIRARGRIGALLEVGTGFHPEMTGRENIYMNGAIMGMRKSEVSMKMDEIIDFSGCERYIDTPVKRYSSGMTVRLGFAVAAHLDPEILVVDEVLAVGDAEFQNKAIGKMHDVSQGEGRTVLFVSHNMASVKSLCKNGILMDKGQIAFQGSMEDTIDVYLNRNFTSSNRRIIEGIKVLSSELRVYEVTINDSENCTINLDYPDRSFTIRVKGELLNDFPIAIECLLYDNYGTLLAKHAPTLLSHELRRYKAGLFELDEMITLPSNLTNGEYRLEIDITYPEVQYLARIEDTVFLRTSGLVSVTGHEIQYSNSGLLFL